MKKLTPPPKGTRAFLEALRGSWRRQARPEQVAPSGDWTTWVFCGGRGSGKTRSGAEWICERVAADARFIHLIGPTAADTRDVLLEGPAGILSISPPHLRPIYQPSLRKVVWPNGAQALLFSSDEPDRLRGPQCDTLWIDELCAMRQAQDVLDNAYFGLRVGKNPRCLITTTPRPIKPFKALLARDGQDVVVTRSSSYANRDNLAPSFFASIVGKYAGTRIGRQELEAELLTDVPGALWRLERIEELRVKAAPQPFERVVVAIDPAVTFGPDADETGIVVCALGADGSGYVLDDLSGRYPPEEWARRAIQAYRSYSADRIIGETNNGGALVEHTLRSVDPVIPYTGVHASRGKLTRAEPVSALYEQGRVHHVGVLGPLEDQLTSYDGSRAGVSPDRLDALVWGLTALMLEAPPGRFLRTEALLRPSEAGALEPIALPAAVNEVFASVVVTESEPDAVAAVYIGLTKSPVVAVILDWDLFAFVPATFDALYPAVTARLQELRLATAAESWRSPITIDPAGVGAVLIEEGIARHHDVRALDTEVLLKRLPVQRAIEFGSHVAGGRVKIARFAHEKLSDYKGVRRNHLLSQIAAFGLEPEHSTVAPLLAAASTGALDGLRADRALDIWRTLGAPDEQEVVMSPEEQRAQFVAQAQERRRREREERQRAHDAQLERENAKGREDLRIRAERERQAEAEGRPV